MAARKKLFIENKLNADTIVVEADGKNTKISIGDTTVVYLTRADFNALVEFGEDRYGTKTIPLKELLGAMEDDPADSIEDDDGDEIPAEDEEQD